MNDLISVLAALAGLVTGGVLVWLVVRPRLNQAPQKCALNSNLRSPS
jgi:hypothetical protein